MIPIRNLYYVLLYAWEHLEIRDSSSAGTAEHDHIVNLLARLLLDSMRPLLRRGLRRDYRAVVVQEAGVHGALLVAPTLRRDALRRGQAVCERDEYGPDVLINQLLKAAITVLLGSRAIDRELRADLRGVWRRFEGIEDVTLAPLSFRRVQLYASDRGYDLPLRVAYLLATAAFPDSGTGGWRIADLRRDERQMAMVWQQFLYRFFAREQSHSRVSADRLDWRGATGDALAMSLLPGMQTDIVLSSSDRKLIIDAKYTARVLQDYHTPKLRSEHLYQLHAYMSNASVACAEQVVEGMLLYPEAEHRVDARLVLAGRRVRVRTINLAQPWQDIASTLLEVVHPEAP